MKSMKNNKDASKAADIIIKENLKVEDYPWI